MLFAERLHPDRLSILIISVLLSFALSAQAQEPPAFEIRIESAYDIVPGSPATVEIVVDKADEEITGFNFLILIDSDTLKFINAEPGEFLSRCGWQYFTFRYYDKVDISINTPTDLIRMIAAAESNSSPGAPDCHLPDSGESLVILTIGTNHGCYYRCAETPIRFFWTECRDNTLTLKTDGRMALSRNVFDTNDENITDTGQVLPGFGGAPISCLDNTPPEEQRLVDFVSGSLGTICPDEICINRGDINCNTIPFEAADAVCYQQLFIIFMSCPEVWPIIPECTIINSDVNADGITLSVSDLVYLVRVLAGDVPSYPKPATPGQNIDIYTRQTLTGTEIRYKSEVDIGGLLMKYQLEMPPESPQLAAELGDMKVEYVAGESQLGILIYDEDGDGDVIPAGDGLLMTIPGKREMELSYLDASDWQGRKLDVGVKPSSIRLQLSQNRPNPFNLATEITLSLPEPSQWRLTVFNILGQEIREYSGHDQAGQISVLWDGCDKSGTPVASGIYFYRAVADGHSQTRKMFLVK